MTADRFAHQSAERLRAGDAAGVLVAEAALAGAVGALAGARVRDLALGPARVARELAGLRARPRAEHALQAAWITVATPR